MKFTTLAFLIAACFLLTGTHAFAQNNKPYEAEWKRIDDLIEKKNLPQSALAEVRKIYAQAKRQGADAQVIKALVYTINLQQENREKDNQFAIQEVEKELAGSKEPVASLLKNLLAHLYERYFQQQRWQLYERTQTRSFRKEDIATWTAEDFHQKISTLYLESISNKAILQQTKLERYETLIKKGNVRHLRPTLYDLLAHAALLYFKNDERELHRPAFAFQINQPEAFAPARLFVQATFATRDSLSLQHKALQVYQELLSFHLNDQKPDALLDADLDRLYFVYQNAVLENKDSLYVAALENIRTQWGSNPAACKAAYLLAFYYEGLTAQYHPLQDTAQRYTRLKAKTILDSVVADSLAYGTSKNTSEGWVNSFNLWQQITQPEFSFELEKVNLPGQPFRVLVNYKNAPVLHFRLVRASQMLAEQFQNHSGEDFWTTLTTASPITNWQQALPQTNDLQQHSVEVKVDALPAGTYVLIASLQENFSPEKNGLGAQLFHVSNISSIQQDSSYFVLHRDTGRPLAGATVQVDEHSYDYTASKAIRKQTGTYQTDEKGFVQLPKQAGTNQNSYNVRLIHEHDTLDLIEPQYVSYRGEETRAPYKTFFFTDKSIYRPGQTVFFKGITTQGKEGQNSIAAGYTTTVFLQNANYKTTDSVQVTTNEYGSFKGSFVLPQGGLNGIFRLFEKEEESGTWFSVEEYKRPRFYVAFDSLKQSYTVNDSIQITGQATAFAGNTVSEARVRYRIVREPRFLYPWLFKRGWWPPAQPMEIAQGEVNTDAQGSFQISFKATPDNTINKKLEPVFHYRVYADVTDINGETRSGEKMVAAGYTSLLLQVKLDERMPVDSFRHIPVRTENMNGVFQPSPIRISITKLVPPDRLIRNRYWQQPDQHLFTQEEFLHLFPHDEYKDESEPRNWQKGATVVQMQGTTQPDAPVSLENTKWEAGFYEVVVTTTDKNGALQKDVQYIELFDPRAKEIGRPVYLWSKGSEQAVEPGQVTSVHIGTAAPDVFLIQQTDKPGQQAPSFVTSSLNKEKKVFLLAAAEADRGGYGLAFFFVRHNRFYQLSDVVRVPWSNKELRVEYATFRDKALPGSEEKWKIKISGAKGEKVAAELLAGMYDASLDQFQEHRWTTPGLWPVYAGRTDWNGQRHFSALSSAIVRGTGSYRNLQKQYDYLIFESRGYNNYPFAYEMAIGPLSSVRQEKMEISYMLRQKSGRGLAVITADTAVANQALTIGVEEQQGNRQNPDPSSFTVRRNFSETAFFFPDLRTDEEGAVEFSFTLPETLTRWKLQTLAHTKELRFGLNTGETVTQKQLMVQPTVPRFLRQGDQLELSAKVVNLSDKEITGQAGLQLLDATTNQSVDGWLQNVFPNQYFTVAAKGSEVVKFPIEVPYAFNKPLIVRVVARAENVSDGEETIVPVLSNKLLVTETLPLPMNGWGTKNFSFAKLLQAGESETLQHQSLTVAYTTNPAWYAVQALPYLTESPHGSAEQTWNRFYARMLAGDIIRKTPRIRALVEQWKASDTTALLSNLQQNEALKSALLEETPWIMEATTEAAQKKNLALLFESVQKAEEWTGDLEKLQQLQSPNGGFVWFPGGPDDRYITQYIVTGIGRLLKLDAVDERQREALQRILRTALQYLDKKVAEDYRSLVQKKANLKLQQATDLHLQYLYLRSFFPQQPLAKEAQAALAYYRSQAQRYWITKPKQLQGMAALALHRTGDAQTPKAILRSLKETAIRNEEQGMYWKENNFGISWHWRQAPIETQSLLIEAFSEIATDTKSVDYLKTWLLKNKQTNNWRTTKATADAVYALLLRGNNWLENQSQATIKLGPVSFSSGTGKEGQAAPEAGTGYVSHTLEGPFVKPEMGTISITVQPGGNTTAQTGAQPSWGAVYWQYFEDMDRITSAATPLRISKKLFTETNSDRGPVLTPVAEGAMVQVGDKIRVRLELEVDRDMEYVHLKDLSASALEPVNVLSGYRWQGGLGYYQTTKDASSNFFFHRLPKGTYVFEYPLFVTHAGNFSNGITTVQCLYAPEFRAQSEGVRLRVE